MLHFLSNRFADDVLNLLTDMLNDDSVVVRLKAVDGISHVMAAGCLKVEERHVVTVIGLKSSIHDKLSVHNLKLLSIMSNGSPCTRFFSSLHRTYEWRRSMFLPNRKKTTSGPLSLRYRAIILFNANDFRQNLLAYV